ncbi:MAG: hypothetical protein DRP92_01355 [Candidatus Neomarinimicrobiota bacterium]|nr:MAG: hypothetical protein DRP92_01355 [Candidatus Neomarinimicrobiota bacterium]
MGVIRHTKIIDDKIQDEAIKSSHIAPDTVVAADIADDAIGSREIADGAVITARIADNAVTEAKTAFLVQSGSVAPPGYFVYPTTLSSLTGWPVACPVTSVSGYADVAVTAANTGSCYVEGGSPGIYAAIMVYGLK